MLVKKGMRVKTNCWWYVLETQKVNKWLRVVSKDGFETIVDIDEAELYI